MSYTQMGEDLAQSLEGEYYLQEKLQIQKHFHL